jgi:deoxyguanosine kinase
MKTSLLERFPSIAIEGPIGVGKSTLARRLAAHLGAELLLERPDENPFLSRFYADQRGYAFQAQLFFLFQRVKQMQQLSQPGMFSRGIVSDFMFAKDALFARMNLDDEEFRLYSQIHAQTAHEIAPPDLVVWLQAEPATLAQRIARRGIAMERHITPGYLQRLCDAYAEHFRRDPPKALFAVVTDRFNPAGHEADFARLIERLDAFEGGLDLLDPSPGASFA